MIENEKIVKTSAVLGNAVIVEIERCLLDASVD